MLEFVDAQPDDMPSQPAVIARLYRDSGFGRILYKLVVIDWPIEEIVVPNPYTEPEYEGLNTRYSGGPLRASMQVSVFRPTRGRQLGRVTAEWYWRTFHEEPRAGLRETDQTIGVVFCDYEEAY